MEDEASDERRELNKVNSELTFNGTDTPLSSPFHAHFLACAFSFSLVRSYALVLSCSLISLLISLFLLLFLFFLSCTFLLSLADLVSSFSLGLIFLSLCLNVPSISLCLPPRLLSRTSPSLYFNRSLSTTSLAVKQYTLVFSHLLTELKEVYKNGTLDLKFTIVKQKPREFWTKFFQDR